MTTWLKWRLGALLGVGLLVAGTSYLHAQNEYPPAPKTPEEAGTQFYQLLEAFAPGNTTRYEQRRNFSSGSLSRIQVTSTVPSAQGRGIESLLEEMAQEAKATQYETRVSESSATQTLVEVSPSSMPKAHEVVVIPEDGGYRVDLKATYGKWNNLSGEALDESWWRYTGQTSPSLHQNPNFLRSQCQSNIKQQMLGILQYTQDYDEKYPPARKWSTVVFPYVKSKQIFICPALTQPGHGYAFNQNFSPIFLSYVKSPATTVNVYETSNLGINAFGPGTGRAYRHIDGWNLGFADGHVKWYSRTNPTVLRFKP